MRPLSSRGSSGLTMLYPLAANSLQPNAQHGTAHDTTAQERNGSFQHITHHYATAELILHDTLSPLPDWTRALLLYCYCTPKGQPTHMLGFFLFS
jgi:hypothetical protein